MTAAVASNLAVLLAMSIQSVASVGHATGAGHATRTLASGTGMPLPLWVYEVLPHAAIGIFVFAFGACLGSFANVLIYRMPEGISVVSPPSRCPTCGARLKWYENLPVIGWLALRGRCRTCGVPISPQYLVVELLMGMLLLWLYLVYFAAAPTAPWWGDLGGAWWYRNGVLRALPAFMLHAILLMALVAMTKIDVRSFHLPTALPNAVVVAAILLWPAQAFLPAPAQAATQWPIPLLPAPWWQAAIGAGCGVLVALAALRAGVLRPSFADYDDYLPPEAAAGDGAVDRTTPPAASSDGPRIELWFLAVVLASSAIGCWINGARGWAVASACATLAALVAPAVLLRRANVDLEEAALAEYPHARREMLRELVFLSPIIAGGAIGFALGSWLGAHGAGSEAKPGVVAALAACIGGYVVAAGIVWAIRIIATVVAGREAMGLGDVHLFGAVGAVLGVVDPIWAFFAAAFFGLGWTAAAAFAGGRGAIQKGSIPFGPHLALATVWVIAFRPVLDVVVRWYV